MVKANCHKNFCTLIFATQKTVDIFERLDGDFDKDFLECIYYRIICFSAKIVAREFPAWEGTEYLSTISGTNGHPLFRFCYDYNRMAKIDDPVQCRLKSMRLARPDRVKYLQFLHCIM